MLGYYKDADATNGVLDRNGYHTGDFGYVDDVGFFYVTGRKDDQIKVGGHRLNPREIEDIVIESGQAVECIIFAIEDAIMGHKLAGLVVPIRETTETRRAILDYCIQKLPKFKVPASLLMVETIPKNSSGKPDRLKSLELYEKSAGKEAGDRD
jgi:acyl-coenzyme A synthetase/AMP-(fatty) acid ligase